MGCEIGAYRFDLDASRDPVLHARLKGIRGEAMKPGRVAPCLASWPACSSAALPQGPNNGAISLRPFKC
jgi:hypothetical protein